MGSRRQALRWATSAQHTKLDGLVGRLKDRSAYSRYLLMTTAFRASVEPEITYAALAHSGLGPLRLSDELEQDCSDLGIAPPSTRLLPGLPQGVSSQIGAMYVIEGSMLGARLLLSDALCLGLSADFGARHLAKQAADPERWKQFQRILEETEDFDVGAAVAAASKVFEAAIQCAEMV